MMNSILVAWRVMHFSLGINFYELIDILCAFSSSNFGVVLVMSMKEKLVTASQALAAGPQPRPKIETVVITLMHLALHSEKIELQVVHILCG